MPHINELIDYCVDVFIVHKNKVLLRKHEKYDMWLSVGGHIELNETPQQAAIREVKEEVGLNVRLFGEKENESSSKDYEELIAPVFMNIHKINDKHRHLSLIYFASSDSDKVVEENEKSKGYKWFTLKELNENKEGIKPEILKYAKTALQKLG